ncbi:hypothetical protein OXX80_005377 [Metschnikowia pulcherrima]
MSWPSSENSQKSAASNLPGTLIHAPSPHLRGPTETSQFQSELDEEPAIHDENTENSGSSRISAYARLDFDHYTFFVQTLQVVLGRKSTQEFLSSAHHSVDVHLSSKKAISRRHAKIFYNFGTQRFEISVLGRNGAFVDDSFVSKGLTVPLKDTTKIQIGDIPFTFVLPSVEPSSSDDRAAGPKLFNPADALNLRSNLYSGSASPKKAKKSVNFDAKQPRRNSKADIVRRLSIARRKSLASSSNDEINALLKELETFHEEEDPTSSVTDENLKGLLHEPGSLTHAELMKEEDEIDALVKQHNLGEGVDLSENVSENVPKNGPETGSNASLPKDLALDISMLDQEVASLAPLIDVPEEMRDSARKAQFHEFAQKSGISKTSSLQHMDALEAQRPFIVGKPGSGPRMGKAATIQPPSNKIYERTSLGSAGPANSVLGTSIPLQPGHVAVPGLIGQVPPPTGYPVPPFPAYGGYTSSYNPIMRPPPPKLEVPVETITSVPATTMHTPSRAIIVPNSTGKPSVCVYKSSEKPDTRPKVPLRRNNTARRPAKTAYSAKDIPEQYKAKPAATVSAMVASVLGGTGAEKPGFTINEIQDRIRDIYPYYKYCPDGWQLSVSHTVRFSKIFVAVSKPLLTSEWLWAIDHTYIEDRNKERQRQQEEAMIRAKEAAARAADYRRPPVTQYGVLGRPNIPDGAHNHQRFSHAALGPGQRPKSIAEIASEIKREPLTKTPQYFQRKPESPSSMQDERYQGTIKAQLAANRGSTMTSGPVTPVPQLGKPPSSAAAGKTRSLTRPSAHGPAQVVNSPVSASNTLSSTGKTVLSPSPKPVSMTGDTKKSLAYLQKELFTLYKARNLTYNTTITTEIITRALATTIAQVNIIGAKAGCGDNALSFLVEKAPQQVSKILDIALTKSIKEKQQGLVSGQTSGQASAQSSRAQTPQPGPPSNQGGLPANSASPAGNRSFAGLSKPQSFTKPGALARPTQLSSSKPKAGEKRAAEEPQPDAKKVLKIDD